MNETAVIWAVIGTGAGITSILLTVLLTVMTMQGRASNARINDQNAMIQARFDDQNQRITELAADVREVRTHLLGTRDDRQAATG